MKRSLLALCFVLLCFSASAQFTYDDASNVDMRRHISQIPSQRREIVAPKTLNGYNVYKADLHMHSIYSDGQVTPEFRVREAYLDGLDVVAITEHVEVRKQEQNMIDFLKGYVPEGTKAFNNRIGTKPADERGIQTDMNHAVRLAEATAPSYGITVIPGTEVTRDPKKIGHYNALFTKDNNLIYDVNPAEAIRNARKQGALIMQNHPGWKRPSLQYLDFETQVYAEGLIDGIEIMNGTEFYPAALDRAREHNLFVTATTDSHDTTYERYALNGVLRNFTFIFAENNSLESLREAISQHRTIAHSYGSLAGDGSLLIDFFKASVVFEVVATDSKGNLIVNISNPTSLPYLLDFGANPLLLNPFKTMRMTVGKDGIMKFKVLNMWYSKDGHPEIEINLN